MCKIMPMNTITVPVGVGRTNLCKLLEKVEARGAGGFNESRTSQSGHFRVSDKPETPWRVETPDDPQAVWRFAIAGDGGLEMRILADTNCSSNFAAAASAGAGGADVGGRKNRSGACRR